MSDEQDKLKLSLEPPKLFGRKKKPDAVGTSKSTSATPAVPDRPSEPSTPVDEEPTDAPAEEPTEEMVEAPVEETVTEELEAPDPAPQAAPEPEPAPPAEADPVAEQVAEPVAEATPEPDQEPATKPVATKPAPAKSAPKRPRAKLAPPIEPEPLSQVEREDAEIVARANVDPLLATYPAAAVTGAVVGLVMVVLTWLSLRGCEAVRDTSSCGGGPGFALLVATFVLCILLGSTLLKLFSIPDPGSSSFLAVGLVAVVSLLFLIDVLDHWSMLIVVPVIGVGSYLASVWVTETFVEPGEA